MEASDCHWFSQLVPDSVKIGCVDWCIDAMERGAVSVCFMGELCFVNKSLGPLVSLAPTRA
jgi:hypothetical protein